jgi:hypothetical protein
MDIKHHRSIVIRYKLKIVASVVLFAFSAFLTPPAEASEREYKIEAAFLYNFINYITWPNHTTPEEMTNATICIDRSDPIRPYLHYMQRKMREERQLVIADVGASEQLQKCQIFFTRTLLSEARLKEALKAKVLVVSDAPDFIEHSGMIGLAPEGSHMVAEINHSLLKDTGFQVSSRLLSLAREVR